MQHPNILANYRLLYKARYGKEWPHSDAELSALIGAIGVLSTNEEQDAAVLEEMEWYFGNRAKKATKS